MKRNYLLGLVPGILIGLMVSGFVVDAWSGESEAKPAPNAALPPDYYEGDWVNIRIPIPLTANVPFTVTGFYGRPLGTVAVRVTANGITSPYPVNHNFGQYSAQIVLPSGTYYISATLGNGLATDGFWITIP